MPRYFAHAARAWPILLALALTGSAPGRTAEGSKTAAEAPTLAQFLEKLGYRRLQLDWPKRQPDKFLLRGKLDGRKALFQVDTGFSRTTVDAARGKSLPRLEPGKLGVVVEGTQVFSDSNAVLLAKVELQGAEFYNEPAHAAELVLRAPQPAFLKDYPWLEYRSAGGPKPDVVLGHDFLARHGAVFHPAGRGLYLRAQALPENSSQVLDATLRQSGLAPLSLVAAKRTGMVAPVLLNDALAWLLVDSGAFTTIMDADFAAKANLSSQGTDLRAVGVESRQAAIRVARLRRFRLGQFELPDREIAVADLRPWLGGATNATSGRIHGLLGADLLISAGAILDYSGTRIFTWIGTPRK